MKTGGGPAPPSTTLDSKSLLHLRGEINDGRWYATREKENETGPTRAVLSDREGGARARGESRARIALSATIYSLPMPFLSSALSDRCCAARNARYRTIHGRTSVARLDGSIRCRERQHRFFFFFGKEITVTYAVSYRIVITFGNAQTCVKRSNRRFSRRNLRRDI